jgi:hypothetical protein
MITPPSMKKVGGMKKRSKASSRTGEKTSEQEVLLAKLLKLQRRVLTPRG